MRMMVGMAALAAVPVLMAAAPVPDARAAVTAAMEASAAGWNRGSLDSFMAVYAEDATFVTEDGKIARGRAAIAAVYAPTFTGGANSRGRLSFEQLAYRQLSPVHAVLTARWTLTPAGGGKAETGLTTVVFAEQARGWKIVADHSA